MVLIFTFFFHWGLDPVCRPEEIISNIFTTTWTFYSLPDYVSYCFSFGKCLCKSPCWDWASAGLFPSGSTLCWAFSHFLAGLVGHSMGRDVGKDAVGSAHCSPVCDHQHGYIYTWKKTWGSASEILVLLNTLLLGDKYNPQGLFLQEGIQPVLFLSTEFLLETIVELMISIKYWRHLKIT